MSLPENLRTNRDTAVLIEQMGDDSAPVRERAAAELFARGRERAERWARLWQKDADLAASFAMEEAGFPKTTVGIAVRAATFERIREANQMPRLADVPPDQDAQEFELHFSPGVQIDVLTTRDAEGNGAIARFLAKFGEGIQQVELTVGNVDRATALLAERFGLKAIYPAARAGADGTRVNFFLLAAEGEKLLIELVEASQ
jgi:hypothetical protein